MNGLGLLLATKMIWKSKYQSTSADLNDPYFQTQKINGEWRVSEEDCNENVELGPKFTSFQLKHLRSDTVYKIELRARNSIGLSSPAQIKIKTARGKDNNYFSYASYNGSATTITNRHYSILFCILLFILSH